MPDEERKQKTKIKNHKPTETTKKNYSNCLLWKLTI